VAASPDIIPYGSATLTDSQLKSTWNNGIDPKPKQINRDQYNNIYVRAKNNYDGPNQGTVELYWTPGSLLPHPGTWHPVPNNNGSKKANLIASGKGEISPGDQAFTFFADSSYPSHFCFVAFIKGGHDNRTLPASDFNSWEEYVDWVRNNANVAWRNVDVLSDVPTESLPVKTSTYNPNPDQQLYDIALEWENCPAGTQLFFYSPPSGTYSGFNMNHTITGNEDPPSIWAGADLPGKFKTSVFAYAVFQGPVPEGASLTFKNFAAVSSNDPEKARFLDCAVHWKEAGLEPEGLSFGEQTRFVPIASVTVYLPAGK
jgi:hypothetical protein